MVTVKKTKKLNVLPLGSRVLIKPFKSEAKEETTSTGLYLPNNVLNKNAEIIKGEVVAIGSYGCDSDMKNGDMVLFGKFGPTEIKIKDEDYLIVNQEDILATYK